jgi:hypothetical protein
MKMADDGATPAGAAAAATDCGMKADSEQVLVLLRYTQCFTGW